MDNLYATAAATAAAATSPPPSHPFSSVLVAYADSFVYRACLKREDKIRRNLPDARGRIGGDGDGSATRPGEMLEPPEALTLDDLEKLIATYLRDIATHRACHRPLPSDNVLCALAKIEAGPVLIDVCLKTLFQEFCNDEEKEDVLSKPLDKAFLTKATTYLSAPCRPDNLNLLTMCAASHNRALTLHLLEQYHLPPLGVVQQASDGNVVTPSLDTVRTNQPLLLWFDYYCDMQRVVNMPPNILSISDCVDTSSYFETKAKQTEAIAIMFKMILALDEIEESQNESYITPSFSYKPYMEQMNKRCSDYIFEVLAYFLDMDASTAADEDSADNISRSSDDSVVVVDSPLSPSPPVVADTPDSLFRPIRRGPTAAAEKAKPKPTNE